MKSYLDQYIDVVEEGLSYDYQATIEFKETQTNWTIQSLLAEFVKLKSTGVEKPGNIMRKYFETSFGKCLFLQET